jgi:hypothetical protein
VAATVLLALTPYVEGYFLTGELRYIGSWMGKYHRLFPSSTIENFYCPMGWLESQIRIEPIELRSRDEPEGAVFVPFDPYPLDAD